MGWLRNNRILRRVGWLVFASYSLLMFWEVFLGPYRSHNVNRSYNLVPFKTILLFSSLQNHNTEVVFINLVANIITFIPLGFFLPWLFKHLHTFKKVFLCSAVIIFSIEIIQFILNVGVLDVDDLILNLAGSGLGYLLYYSLL